MQKLEVTAPDGRTRTVEVTESEARVAAILRAQRGGCFPSNAGIELHRTLSILRHRRLSDGEEKDTKSKS
jgi:hypothetical protein